MPYLYKRNGKCIKFIEMGSEVISQTKYIRKFEYLFDKKMPDTKTTAE